MADNEYSVGILQAELEDYGAHLPVYAETPHGTYLFVIDKIKPASLSGGEHGCLLVLREISREE